MERTTPLVERLREIEEALGANDCARARELLVAIRDGQGPRPAGLSAQIDALSSPDADARAAVEWVEEALFEQSLSADLAADSDWLEIDGDEADSSGAGEGSSSDAAAAVDLEAWDQLDDFDAFDDFDGFDLDDEELQVGGDFDASAQGRPESNAKTRVPDEWYQESTKRLDASAAAGLADSSRSGRAGDDGAGKGAKERDSDPFAGLNLFGDDASSMVEEVPDAAEAKKERARGLSGMFKVPPPTATGVDPLSVFEDADRGSQQARAQEGEDAAEQEGGTVRETKQYAAATREDAQQQTAVGSNALPAEERSPAPGGGAFGDAFADIAGDLDGGLSEASAPAERQPLSPRERQSFDSGSSVARYAGIEPPPPPHRSGRSSSSSGSASLDFEILEESAEDEELDFDLGFERPPGVDSRLDPPSEAAMAPEDDSGFDLGLNPPEVTKGAVKAPDEPRVVEDDFDFDLGFTNPVRPTEPRKQSEPTRTGPGLDDESSAPKAAPEAPGAPREDRQTPISQMRAVPRRGQTVDEDEFFALAESLAAESSGANEHPYRGEPLVRERPARTPSGETFEVDKDASANAFAHDAPTGVRHAFVESSFVLEELSSAVAAQGQDANLSAILMEARRLYENGSFVESLAIVDKVLSRASNDEARDLRASIEREMERALLDRLGSMTTVPRLAVELGALASLDLDHRAGYLLSQVDGMMSYEDIIELSGMPRLETMQVLVDMLEKGVLTAS